MSVSRAGGSECRATSCVGSGGAATKRRANSNGGTVASNEGSMCLMRAGSMTVRPTSGRTVPSASWAVNSSASISPTDFGTYLSSTGSSCLGSALAGNNSDAMWRGSNMRWGVGRLLRTIGTTAARTCGARGGRSPNGSPVPPAVDGPSKSCAMSLVGRAMTEPGAAASRTNGRIAVKMASGPSSVARAPRNMGGAAASWSAGRACNSSGSTPCKTSGPTLCTPPTMWGAASATASGGSARRRQGSSSMRERAGGGGGGKAGFLGGAFCRRERISAGTGSRASSEDVRSSGGRT
mmetsp:Transcript_22357/g.40200  ORF Transcript_22357/g.40200 Transcript_22357/m.40200 type:complete len:294 (-) Transcript_22357:2768-3649(-)